MLIITAVLVSSLLVRKAKLPFSTRVSSNCGSTLHSAIEHGSLQSAQAWGDSALVELNNLIFLYEYNVLWKDYELKWVKYDSDCGDEANRWLEVNIFDE